MSTLEAPNSLVHTTLRRPGVRQFVKFCIVGFSSMLIDFGIYFVLIECLDLQKYVASWALAAQLAQYLPAATLTVQSRILAQSVSFLFAVSNGFYWNSRWTFQSAAPAAVHARYAKFVFTNIIGLLLNLTILTIVAHLVPPFVTRLFAGHLRDPAGLIGKLMATGVVVFWNFIASRYWTFKS